MTKPYMEALIEALGDPKLNKVIEILKTDDEAIEEIEEEHYGDMTVEEMGEDENRYLDAQNARDINRRIG